MFIYIKSMSEAQSRIYDNLTAVSKQIDMHIIRLLLYPDSKYVDHWMHEVWSFLFDIDTLKRKNTYPKASFIKKALSTHNDILGNYVKIVKSLESELTPQRIDLATVEYCVEEYQDWIAEQLSKYGYVEQKDVKEVLQDICDL